MCHFYSQGPPSHKHFNPWDVELLLSLLESWALASSLSTLKPAWKTATLSTCYCIACSDLTLLCIDNQNLFLQCHAAIFIPMFGGKTYQLVHIPPQICIEFHSNVNLHPIFVI